MSQYIVVISASSSLSSSSHTEAELAVQGVGVVAAGEEGGSHRSTWNFGGNEQNYCLFVHNFVKISFQYRRMFVIFSEP